MRNVCSKRVRICISYARGILREIEWNGWLRTKQRLKKEQLVINGGHQN
jgi:hypothetical protein